MILRRSLFGVLFDIVTLIITEGMRRMFISYMISLCIFLSLSLVM